MAALVAALLIRASDSSLALVATIAERSRRISATLAGLWLATIVTQGVAAAAGWLMAPHLTPNAARLLLAVALIGAGAAVFPKGKPVTVESGKLAFWTTALRLLASGIGDRSGFVTFAIAAGGVPALAGIGGGIGNGVVLSAAAVAGETLLHQAPRRVIAIAIGGVLLFAGIWIGLAALRLI